MIGKIKIYFGFDEHGANFRAEAMGGLTTFMTMAYIIVVNPAILGNTEIGAGMDFNSVLMATCLASALATLVMGLAARYPIALAPGMGLNAFFSFEIVNAAGVPWQTALGMVFISGTLFLILTFARVREMIINAIPETLKYAIAAGIGVFIAFIGLQHAGIIVDNPATLVGLGKLNSRPVLVSLAALIAAMAMMAAGVRGAVLWGILIAFGLGLLFGEIKPEGISVPTLMPFDYRAPALIVAALAAAIALKRIKVPGGEALGVAAVLVLAALMGWIEIGSGALVSMPPSMTPTFLQLDIPPVFTSLKWIGLVLILLFFDLFDTVGTLIGVTSQAGLLKDGKLPRATHALAADAVGTMAGALLGTSTTTSYIESAAGVAAGARTGFANLVTAALFLAAIFFSPLASLLAQGMITAPALILVGVLMMAGVRKIKWDDFYEAAPAFVAIVLMPLTFSIATGLVAGIIVWPLCQVAAGKAREVHPFIYALSAILVVSLTVGYILN